MAGGGFFAQLQRRLSAKNRRRGAVLRRFYTAIGAVYFGAVHQHDDDINVIRGFTASLTHHDTHYAVGSFKGYDIRIVDRLDTIRTNEAKHHAQQWVIMEFDLHRKELHHFFFLPTSHQSGEYARLFATQPYLQPLNSMLMSNYSPEFHGRYQILARTTHSQEIERFFSSPVIVGIAARFWPHGIEVEHGKLLIYINEPHITKPLLEATFAAALWLAETIDSPVE